jgi:23S rRNA pseudouridine1911/1915/1917 synthase
MITLSIAEACPLLKGLFVLLPDWHHHTLRQRLRTGGIRVNGRTVTVHDHPLRIGDKVEVLDKAQTALDFRTPYALRVLYEDDDLIAIRKPDGLLAVSAEGESRRTALAQLVEMIKARGGSARSRLWPVHRLDRDTSGVMLFARAPLVQRAMQDSWGAAEKIYWAVVRGIPCPSQGTIQTRLLEGRDLMVRAGNDLPGAVDAVTHYRTLRTKDGAALLEVKLGTGRKHQIRVHLASIGHPVIGDRVYGDRVSTGRLALHAVSLSFSHPGTGRRVKVESPWPNMLGDIAPGPAVGPKAGSRQAPRGRVRDRDPEPRKRRSSRT